jgi:hypothetical protein
MFKLNFKWKNNELELPGGARFCIEYDSTECYVMLYGEAPMYMGTFLDEKAAKKFCEDYYTLKVLKMVKEL